jgi:hypothetical protein
MQRAVTIRDAIAIAKRIERIALAGMKLAGHQQGIEHTGAARPEPSAADAGEFGIEKGQVESRVVDQHLSAIDEGEQLIGHLGETRLVAQVVPGHAVHLGRRVVDLAFGVQIDMQGAAGQAPGDDLEAADLDDPMALIGRQPGGLGIENDLPHEPAAGLGPGAGARGDSGD